MFVLGALALSVAVPGAGPASAAVTWTVQPGGPFWVTGPLALVDSTGRRLFSCASVTLRGTLRSGSGLPGAGIGMLPTSSTFMNCTSSLGATITVTPIGLWSINAESYDSLTRVVTGTITNVSLNFSSPLCSARQTGFLSFEYHNLNAALYVWSGFTLVVGSVNGCFGLIAPGARIGIERTRFAVSPPQTITSP